MRHIVSILLQNESGALARVAGLFAARGYNIDSLTVAATHDPLVSRLTLVTRGDDAVIEQILQQSRKLIDVLDIADLTAREHLEVELLIAKLAIEPEVAPRLAACVRRHARAWGSLARPDSNARANCMNSTVAASDSRARSASTFCISGCAISGRPNALRCRA